MLLRFRVTRSRLVLLGQDSAVPRGAIRREPVRKTVIRHKKAITMDVFNRVRCKSQLVGLILHDSFKMLLRYRGCIY